MLTPKFEPTNMVVHKKVTGLFEVIAACIYEDAVGYIITNDDQTLYSVQEEDLALAPEQKKQQTLAEVVRNALLIYTKDIVGGEYGEIAKAVETEVRRRLSDEANKRGWQRLSSAEILNIDIGE